MSCDRRCRVGAAPSLKKYKDVSFFLAVEPDHLQPLNWGGVGQAEVCGTRELNSGSGGGGGHVCLSCRRRVTRLKRPLGVNADHWGRRLRLHTSKEFLQRPQLALALAISILKKQQTKSLNFGCIGVMLAQLVSINTRHLRCTFVCLWFVLHSFVLLYVDLLIFSC